MLHDYIIIITLVVRTLKEISLNWRKMHQTNESHNCLAFNIQGNLLSELQYRGMFEENFWEITLKLCSPLFPNKPLITLLFVDPSSLLYSIIKCSEEC